MKRIGFALLLLVFFSPFQAACASDAAIKARAHFIMQQMTLAEKIGQKLMLDFRYWCTDNTQHCMDDLVASNRDIETILKNNHIGGVILFANNLKTPAGITALTYHLQNAMLATSHLPLLMGIDQEGGIVGRLPRNSSPIFSGNMAMTAAYLGQPEKPYVSHVATAIAKDIQSLGFNMDFAPDVDVNMNPLNPVIHVRSFSDSPQLVARLGSRYLAGLQLMNVGGALKHFPGHGDTVSDSHLGLPVVHHSADQAWAIDLAPFQQIIKQHEPDMIMTAHIQFPALDDSVIYADLTQENIVKPATLSRKIISGILRDKLHYHGVVITDALDMGAISQYFSEYQATLATFKAGVDIALMPVSITNLNEAAHLTKLIQQLEKSVADKTLSLKELNQSVERILVLKIELGLFNPDDRSLSEKIHNAEVILHEKNQYELEKQLADSAITVVQNRFQQWPLHVKTGQTIHILTPWPEQAAAFFTEINVLQKEGFIPKDLTITYSDFAHTNLAHEKSMIANADVIIVGFSTTQLLASDAVKQSVLVQMKAHVLPVKFTSNVTDNHYQMVTDNIVAPAAQDALTGLQLAYQALQYAFKQSKQTVFVSLLAPYDLATFKDVSSVMLASYNHFGLVQDEKKLRFYRGPNLPAVIRVLFGKTPAMGKLPIDIPNPQKVEQVVYHRGYGLKNV